MIKKGETYIIGEIGQNHNGSVDIAKLIVVANIIVFPFAYYNIRKKIQFVFSVDVLKNVMRYSLPMFFMVIFAWFYTIRLHKHFLLYHPM
mgnify:CR=1 FL=1